MTTARLQLLLASLTWLALAPVIAARDETLDKVKALYQSAAYEQALAVLEEAAADPALSTSMEAQEYRLFCLIALERTTDARAAIASMLNADPFYQLPPVAPRVRTIFGDTRRSLLPGIVQRAYAEAKTAFDRQDPQSTAQFERVLTLLNEPDVAAAPALADLRTVVSAFLDLSKALALRPVPPPATEPVAPPETAASPLAAAAAPVVYRGGEPNLLVPQTLNQTLPRWILPPQVPGRDPRGSLGTLELVIDENGDVASVRLLRSFHPEYDAQLIRAAMAWKYKPAQKDGAPVRFVKVVTVRLDRPDQGN